MYDIKDKDTDRAKKAVPPTTINQNPEQIARDQMDAKLVQAGRHIQSKDKRLRFRAKKASCGTK